MSILIENSNKPASITIERIEQPSTNTHKQEVVTEVREIIRYERPTYDINIVEGFGGFFILLGAILLVMKVFGGNDFFGSIIRGVTTVVGGLVLFIYCFGMAIL